MNICPNEVILWGATGQAKVIHEALTGTNFKIVALFDKRQIPSPLNGIPIHYGLDAFDSWLKVQGNPERFFAAPAIGGARGKDRLSYLKIFLERNLRILSVRHPTAFVACNAQLGEGSQILALAAICASVKIGRAVIVNTSASVDHDCMVGDGAHIGPGAKIAGEVIIGKNALIGTGAVILPGITIGENAIVGAGSVVTKNVAADSTVVGNPARLRPCPL